MNRFAYDIVGFDLDGTLLDTSGDLAAACNHALTGIGRPALPVADIRTMIGGGTGMMLRRALEATGGSDEALFNQLSPVLFDYYEAHIANLTRPFPGLIDALDALAGMGVKLAVASNKIERLCTRLLNEIGMIERFECVLGGDSVGHGRGKPNPDLLHEMVRRCGGGRAAFIGDSEFDVGAAKAAGLPSVVVSFGF
ncbi:MAG: HAD-IA family hydrolase, partial [Alphaproteobacteria bacterium]|nr:HAD-IA family hydrolase [Alphaproteobacteria bacterium]